MKVSERTCGNCAWFKPRPEEANHDVPAGLCQLEPLAVDKVASDRCSRHETVEEVDENYAGDEGFAGLVAPTHAEILSSFDDGLTPGPDAA